MTTIPSDPLFPSQWHLRNTASGEFDLNVVDVWDDYTGKGVEVAIIDDAVQRNHPDLDGNYSAVKDWDFDNNDTDPSGIDGQNHGTATSGIVGENAGNGIGGVGVAFGSTIFGFQVNGFISNAFIQQLAEAIDNASGLEQTAGQDRTADVVNMSLGTQYSSNFFDQGLSATDMTTLNAAIDNAVEWGRDGLGTILVKSAGNGRNDNGNHDTNASSWNANVHTISVAAVDRDGTITSYSTHGSSNLVSAFGSPIPGEVVTTDRVGSEGYSSGDYTGSFNGTSAAAPMVTGVVALMLDANPNLGWRDVQDILAYSARHVGTSIGGGTSGFEEYAWAFNAAENWNGGGLHFSNDYGFGLVDAKAAVRLAETWGSNASTSANNVFAIESAAGLPVAIPDGDSGGVNFVLNENTANISIEHFELRMIFSTTYIGDLEITVTSPSGTSSRLIDNTGATTDFDGNWVFTSNAFRGEQSAGNWTVNVVDSFSRDTLVVDSLSIYSWGAPLSSNETFIFTNEFSDYDGLFGHSRSVDGGSGTDVINAAAVDANTTLNLQAGTGVIDGVVISTSSIENAYTGDGSDTIIGNAVANNLRGGRGNDWLLGNAGDDSLDGGEGYDFALYFGAPSGVVVDLAAGTASGGDGTDSLASIEGVGGSEFADTLLGNDARNNLLGYGGPDHLDGRGGKDTLIGGRGADVQLGGAGADSFVFTHKKDSQTGGHRDLILDFNRAEDLINLAAIDAKKGGGNQKFKWIGKHDFHDKRGELHYVKKHGDVIVEGDINGNGEANFQIRLDDLHKLNSHDFVL